MSNLNKEIEEALAEIDVPSDDEIKKETSRVLRQQNGKALSNNPKWIESNRQARKAQGLSKEYREAVSIGVKKKYDDEQWSEEKKRRQKALCNSEEFKQKCAARIRKKFEDKDFRKKHADGAKKRVGEGNGRYLGVKVGTCMTTGKKIRCISNQDIKSAGFSQSKVSECINGNRKHHKGYTWKLEPK
jgi:hypothetical protein